MLTLFRYSPFVLNFHCTIEGSKSLMLTLLYVTKHHSSFFVFIWIILFVFGCLRTQDFLIQPLTIEICSVACVVSFKKLAFGPSAYIGHVIPSYFLVPMWNDLLQRLDRHCSLKSSFNSIFLWNCSCETNMLVRWLIDVRGEINYIWRDHRLISYFTIYYYIWATRRRTTEKWVRWYVYLIEPYILRSQTWVWWFIWRIRNKLVS